MDKTPEERRKQNRIQQHSIIKVNESLALLVDISLNGMRLACQKIPDSREVEIRITIYDVYFLLQGEIRWHSKKSDFSNMYDMGVQIHDPPKKYLELLKTLLE